MTSSRNTQSPSMIFEGGVIPPETLAYLTARTKNRTYDYILRKFLDKAKSDGLTKAELARRLGKRPEVINRLLGAPGNWGLETVAELLAGIAEEELEPNSSSLNRPPSNYSFKPWIDELSERRSSSALEVNARQANPVTITRAEIGGVARNVSKSQSPSDVFLEVKK